MALDLSDPSSRGSAYLIKMERLEGAVGIVAVCNRRNELLQLWSVRLPLSAAQPLITSNDGALQIDFKKLLNKVWETNACNCVIGAECWAALGSAVCTLWHCHETHRVLWQCGDNAMDKGRDAAVLLSFAMLRNTARAKTSIIMRAHKIINCADKTSEQIDPKQKDRGETSAVD